MLVVNGGPTDAGRKLPLKPKPHAWTCPMCSHENDGYWATCPNCYEPRP